MSMSFFLNLAAFAGGFSTLGLLALAVYAVCQNNKIARERNTLDFINEYNDDPRIDKAYKFLREKSLEEKKKAYDEGGEDRANFLVLMNKFEILASGLKCGVYDQKLVDRMLGDGICEAYDDCEDLIKHIRKNDKSDSEDIAFEHFQKLAARVNYEKKGKY